MRSPGAALIRARAKAPLPDLQVLHLSNAVIECIKHLELCKCLQSLYADNNRIRDVEGVIQLRKLWRIDLNGNLLKDLQALASFRTLGFLYLERNRICFEDLICLRDQHVLELRLLGNKSLMKGNSIHEYRKKVVALLPNVWILDGHFISTTERQQAIEEFDPFVANLRQSAIGNRKFGSETDMWMDMERISKETVLTPGTRLIKTTHKTANPQEAPDLTRFHAIVAFHNDESAIHNAYCQFAPSRHSPNSQLMPKIWLDEILALPRRTRIEVMVLLAVFLQFRFPKVLLTEALTIRQLDSPQFPSEAIRDTVNLPPYALVALIAITRHVSLETEHSMREELKPETTTPEFEDESKLLGAIPPLFTTLFSSSDTAKPVGETDPQSTAIRCRQAIKLLSIVASFPDPEIVAIKGKGKREAIFRELAPLFRAAEAESSCPASQSGKRGVVIPSVNISKHKTTQSSARNSLNMMLKRTTMASDCEEQNIPISSDGGDPETPQCTVCLEMPKTSGRKPKPGDWVELHSKQFVKIQFLSGDGLFVVGAFPTDTSRSITIPLKQISRISNSVWRANSSAMQQTEELFQRARSDRLNNPQLGKLHRDSEAFHRHGAARNQGFPNHFVTAQVLEALEQEESNAAPSLSRTKAVEIFSSNDTLDANYVLASPAHISAQNYCAFIQQHHQPRGIWSPVKQPAPYSILASKTPTLGKSSSLNELKTKPHFQKPNSVSRSQPLDDWHEIRRAMQAQLGIVDDIKRPLTTSSSTTSLQTSSECFITAPPNCCITTEDLESAPIVRFRVKTPPVLQQKLTVARDWRQIATKTEFVVAASPDAQLTRGTPGPITTPKLKSAILPSISHKNVPLTCSK